MKKIAFTHPALVCPTTDKQITLYLPATRIVCPTCNGYGHHFRSDLDENGLIDSMKEDGDYEGINMYYKGAFDQNCSECKGQKVLDEIDMKYFYEEHPKEAKAIDDWEREEMEYVRYAEQERRFGA